MIHATTPSIYVNDRRWDFPYIERTDFGEHDGVPVWSPDGRYVAFDSERDGNRDIYVIDTDTDEEHRLTNNSESDLAPTWSPDGTQIAFVSRRTDSWDIYVMDADGEDEYLRRLTNESDWDPVWSWESWDPAWSPDGKYIAFVSGPYLEPSIYLMDADGSNVRQLTYGGVDPAWSPDGKYIAYRSASAGNIHIPNIYVIDADGSNDYRLTNYDGYDGEPVWSPEGTQIAFVSSRDGDDNIYVMKLLGSCK